MINIVRFCQRGFQNINFVLFVGKLLDFEACYYDDDPILQYVRHAGAEQIVLTSVTNFVASKVQNFCMIFFEKKNTKRPFIKGSQSRKVGATDFDH